MSDQKLDLIAEEKARHEKTLAALERKAAIVAQLPEVPTVDGAPLPLDGLQKCYDAHLWATYKTKNLRQVADVIRAYGSLIVPTTEVRDGCLYRLPIGLMRKAQAQKAETEGNDVIFSLETHQGRGFGPCVDFWFFVQLQSGAFVKIRCDLPDSWHASARLTAPDFDRYGHPQGNGRSAPNPILSALFDKFIAWSPNERGLDARYTYTLCDDGPDYRNTVLLLENTVDFSDWWK